MKNHKHTIKKVDSHPKTVNLMSASTNDKHPAFCFKYNRCKGFTVDDIDDKERLALINHIYKIGYMTWQECQNNYRHSLGGCEKISIDSLNVPVPREITDNIKELLAMRYNGKKAILGFREHKVFHIVVIDPWFKAYNHN